MTRRTRLLAFLFVALAIASPCAAQKDTATHTPKVSRGRILGVFDAITGQPVADVEIKDISSGLSSHTTETGTLSLFFLDAEASLIQIRKVGYHPTSMLVTNSPLDTGGITVMLIPVGHVLEGIVAVSRMRRGLADTVPALMESGFYERRNSALAPASAFLTADRIHGLELVSSVRNVMGRPICTTNLFINGSKVVIPARRLSGGGLKQGIDAMIPDPDAIAAIETYNAAEIPPEFAGTFSSPGLSGQSKGDNSADCATMIWLK